MEPKEAWKRLDERYVHRTLVAISNLTHFNLPAGLTHEKIEALVQGIRVANARLQAVTGEGEQFANCFIVGPLVEQIEQKVRTRGCHHQAKEEHSATVLKHG